MAGFREIEHTADWALEVWAPDFGGLLVQAARGMMQLSGTVVEFRGSIQRIIPVTGEDRESQLVNFLNELLFLGETEGLAFGSFEVKPSHGMVEVLASGGAIASQTKAIKAVTFHNLAIRRSSKGLTVNLVFDV